MSEHALVCGTHEAFRDWQWRHREDGVTYRHVASPAQVRGYERGIRLYLIHGFRDTPLWKHDAGWIDQHFEVYRV